jgi:hypothetical protein
MKSFGVSSQAYLKLNTVGKKEGKKKKKSGLLGLIGLIRIVLKIASLKRVWRRYPIFGQRPYHTIGTIHANTERSTLIASLSIK